MDRRRTDERVQDEEQQPEDANLELNLPLHSPNDRHWYESKFEEELEILGGKRDKSLISRADSLDNIKNFLKQSYLHEFLDILKINSELIRILKQTLNSEVKEETINSSKILNLWSITCPECMDLYHTFSLSLLHYALKSDSYDTRTACLKTLCTFCFIFDLEETTFRDCFKIVQKILRNELNEPIDKETECFYECALDMWCLLVTRETDEYIMDNILPEDLESLASLLNEDNLTVRLAASEAIALLSESVQNASELDSLEYFSDYCDTEKLIETLSRTNIHDHRKISKYDRTKQRQSFKDTLNCIEKGTSASVQVNVNETNFTFDNRADITVLSFFKSILGGGFLIHMQSNPLLAKVLQFSVPKGITSTQKAEKKIENVAIRDKKDKFRTQKRNMYRGAKQNFDEEDQ